MIFADFGPKKFPEIIKVLQIIVDLCDFSKNL
jgi:hypothetical protein